LTINNWDNKSTLDKITTFTGAIASITVGFPPLSLALGAITLGLIASCPNVNLAIFYPPFF
jgi:hypothetical protein